MIVTLYAVGRNLNRAVRTCEAFGVQTLHLLNCPGAYLGGNLFRASGRVSIMVVDDWPSPVGLCAIETTYALPIYELDWHNIDGLLIGGETSGLPPNIDAEYRTYIPMVGHISGLTVEAALAIALYEWRRQTS